MSNSEKISKELIRLFKLKNQGSIISLNGPWGCGKTFLWKEKISKQLETELKIPIMYFSCFGIESLDSLKSSLAGQYLKNGNVEKSEKGKKILEFLSKKAVKIGQKKLFGEDVLSFSFDLLDFLEGDFVICFDDIERKSEKISIVDLLGLFSFISEHKNGKILLISNENEIPALESESFKKYKEKTISEQFNLETDFSGIYDRIVSFYEKKASDYFEKNKNQVLKIFKKADTVNLRTLKKYLNKINYLLSDDIFLEEKYLNIFAAYLFEHSSDGLKDLNFYNFSPGGVYLARKILEKDEKELFLEKYFDEYLDYEYIPEFIELTNNGFLNDSQKLKDRLFPKPEQIPRSKRLINGFNQLEIYYQNEVSIKAVLDETTKCLKEDALNTAEIIGLVSYLKLFNEFINQPQIDPELEKIVISKLKENLQKVDNSFSGSTEAVYSQLNRYWQEYMFWYKEEIEIKNEDLKKKNYKEIIKKEDFSKIKEITNFSDEVLTLVDLLLNDTETSKLWKTSPKLFELMVTKIFNNLRATNNLSVIEKVKAYLQTAIGSADADGMDKYRLTNFLKAFNDYLTSVMQIKKNQTLE